MRSRGPHLRAGTAPGGGELRTVPVGLAGVQADERILQFPQQSLRRVRGRSPAALDQPERGFNGAGGLEWGSRLGAGSRTPLKGLK